MTTQDWLAQARRDAGTLAQLLSTYHPLNRPAGRGYTDQRITAAGAEAACEAVRAQVAAEGGGDPVVRFNAALNSGDAACAFGLLNEAWFGVPESTACWQIDGFSEAVALCEDPPGDEREDGDGD